MKRLLLLALAAAWLAPAAARAEGLVLALYLPDTPLSLQQLTDLGASLGRQLGSALGVTVLSRTYRKEDDFVAALRDGTVDLALCEPLLVATRGLAVLGVATSAPPERTTTQLALWGMRPLAKLLASASPERPLRVAGVRSTRHRQLVQRVLLEGAPRAAQEIQWLAAPDVLSSLEVVRGGRAELAAAPLALAGGPSDLLATPLGAPVPNPAVVTLSTKASSMGDRLRAALPRIRLEGPYAGLRASAARPYQALAVELAGEAPGQQRVPLLPAPRPPLPVLPAPTRGAGRLPLTLPPAGALVGF